MNRWMLFIVLPVGLAALCALPLTGPPGILVGAAAVLAVAAAVQPRIALVAALGSILADALHPGPPEPAALWFPVEMLALAVLQVRAIRHTPTRRAAWTGGLVGLAITALPLRMTLHLPDNRFEGAVLLVSSAFVVAVAATGAGLYLRAGDQRRRRAEDKARRAHRLDLARDLHDLVAHEVTGIVVEAQAAQVAAAAQDPRSFAAIEAAGLRALDAMDHMVHTLRGPGEQAPLRVHGLADLPDVVARFDATGPTRATLRLAPGLALPPEAGTVAYHIVIEALTNVRRHAPLAGTVVVALAADGTLTVVNSGGTGPQRPRNGGGTGLAGLAERVRAIGGSLHAGPHPTGWQVVCKLSRSADVQQGAAPDA